MDKQRMQELIENFIDYLIDCNGDIDDVLLILELNIGMKKTEWEKLGLALSPDPDDDDE